MAWATPATGENNTAKCEEPTGPGFRGLSPGVPSLLTRPPVDLS